MRLDPRAGLDGLLRDTRHALRRLGRDRRFTAAAVLLLALGIGVNTAGFSAVNAALFRASSLVEPERLVFIYQNGVNPEGVDASSYPAYLDMAEYTDVFASTTAASVPLGVVYQNDGALRPAVAEYTTASYLSVLGLPPAHGRWFSPAEDRPGAGVVGVIGYRTWTRKFGGDPSVVGRTIRIEGVPVTIVGVGPAGHAATIDVGIATDFWLPIASLPALGVPARVLERRPDEAGFLVKARLRDGVTVAQAQAAMHVLGARLASEYPTEDPGRGISVVAASGVRVHPQLDAVLKGVAFVLLGVVGLVLAIACTNLATLLLVRGAARARDISVRLALGATRGQLVRHLLIESVLLAAAGGAAGCLLAWWAVRILGTLDLPIVVDLSLDGRVLLFAIGLSLCTGVAFGLAPALRATRVDLVPTLRDGGGTRSAEGRWLTLQNALIVLQVAGSVLLLGGTALFLQLLDASRSQRIGFAVEGVAMLETDARFAGYATTEAGRRLEELRRRVAAIPGVQSAALTHGLPMQASGVRVVVDETTAGPAAGVGGIWAGPGFFETLRIPILYGRAIDDRDRSDRPRVAVINESMARQAFGTADAVGRRFRLERDETAWFEIVGVARDTGTANLSGDLVDPTPHLLFRSFEQANLPADTVLARTAADAAGLVGAMERELRAVDGALPVVSAKTMAEHLEESLLAPKTVATVLAGLGALGLVLAGLGLYAAVSFRVSRRAREIGIRMALGARGPQVVWTVTREVAALVAIGTGLGLTVSLLAGVALRAVSAPAPGISFYRPTADPAALFAIAAFMAAVGLAAASAPTWRATRIEPMTALRHD